MPKRVLTLEETAVLIMIQQGYGEHNAADKVFFSQTNEAVIFVRLANGNSCLLANLSNLAAGRANGTIASDEELKTKWLRIKASQKPAEAKAK